MAEMMQAVRLHDYGGPDQLKLDEVVRPEPGTGEVLIRLMAAGVNPADWKAGEGLFKQFSPLQFPWTPGLEGAGIVEATGPAVRNFRKGDAVYGAMSQTYAEYALAKEGDIQPKPANISFEEAAGVPVGALTAWGAVIDKAQVQQGQRVLVQGAAGGVGVYAAQLARWKGAQAAGTASAANIELLRSLGIETPIDYNATSFETQVHDLDAVIDTVGGELMARSLKVLRPGGIYVTVAGRPPQDAGQAEGVRATSAGRASPDTLHEISNLIESGQMRPVAGPSFPLKEAGRAQALSETRHGHGRIVIVMRS